MPANPLIKLRKIFKRNLELDLSRGKPAELKVNPTVLFEVCRFLKEDPKLEFTLLIDQTAIDHQDYLELVYYIYSFKLDKYIYVKAVLNPNNLIIDSITAIWRGANWLERETYDMFGIVFDGHPNLKRILLTEEYGVYPLRKDFHLRERRFEGDFIESAEK